MEFPFGQEVYRDRPAQVPDPYRPGRTVPDTDWSTASTLLIPGAWVASSSSIAQADATRSQVLVSKSLYCAPDSDVKVGDRIRTADAEYFVNEMPEADINPFTGWQPVREVPLDSSLG